MYTFDRLVKKTLKNIDAPIIISTLSYQELRDFYHVNYALKENINNKFFLSYASFQPLLILFHNKIFLRNQLCNYSIFYCILIPRKCARNYII